jgi:hypothetical protein
MASSPISPCPAEGCGHELRFGRADVGDVIPHIQRFVMRQAGLPTR